MYLQDVQLINYIGILNGLGLEELFIDFRKCRNTITIIKGDNGSGKTTLHKALNPLPDSSDCFVPGKTAVKKISYYNEGITYTIKYVSEENSKGGRTTKGYFHKIDSESSIELNPGGNITECKELIYEHFQLDSNFMALSQLSSEDRGLVDKKPSERKRFINAIIDSVVAYNNIYKTLARRSSTFKAMVNSISSKIDNLGNPELVKNNLESVNNRITELTRLRDEKIAIIASQKEKLSSLNSEDIDSYKQLEQEQLRLEAQLDQVTKELNTVIDKNAFDKNATTELLQMIHDKYVEHANNYKIECDKREANIQNLLDIRSKESELLNDKVVKLKSLTDDVNYKGIKESLQTYKNTLDMIEKSFNELNFDQYMNISKEEYETVLNTLDTLYYNIDQIRSRYTFDEVINAGDVDLINNINFAKDDIKTYKDELSNVMNDITRAETITSLYSNITNIEEECLNNKKCAFRESFNILHDKSKLSVLNTKRKSLEDNIEVVTNTLKSLERSMEVRQAVNSLLGIIGGMSSILYKFPNCEDFLSKEIFMKKFYNNDKFNRIENITKYREYTNYIILYKSTKLTIESLSKSLAEYDSKEFLVKEILEDINRLQESTDDLLKKVNSLRSLNENTKSTIETCNEYINKLKLFMDTREAKKKVEDDLIVVKSNMLKISETINTYNQLMASIGIINQEKISIENNLNTIIADRDNLNYAIKMLEEYMSELKIYQEKFDLVETIKYFSSPTTGIQTLFMELYMNKITTMGNNLLSLVFNGEYTLYPFVINEDEFRIPCKGKGIINDDISSMSTSQKCMISMILSFALLKHSSTKYNILKLDEIDSGLDSINRLQFISLLNSLMEKLGCTQCIMISHNNEINLDTADLIILKNSDPDFKPNGNIIYQY